MTSPRTLIRLLAVTFCVAALLAVPAVAGDTILKVIPKDAIAFVVVNNIENADQICTELSEAVQVPIPTLSSMLKEAAGVDEVLNQKGDMALVVYQGGVSSQSGEQPICALLPVKNYQKFLSTFEGAEEVTDAIHKISMKHADALVARKDGYAVIVQESSQSILEAFLAAKADIAGEMQPWKIWMNRQAAYGVLTNHGLQKYLKEGIDMLEGTLESFEQFPTSPQLEQIKKTLAIYLTVIKAIRDNTNQIGLGLAKVGEGAIQVSVRCDAKPDSDLAKMMDDLKSLPTSPMSVLPDGSFVLAAGGPIPQKATAMLIEFGQGMNSMQLGLSEEQNEKMVKLAIEAVKPVLGQSFIIGSPNTKEGSAFDNAYGVMWVTSADDYFTAYKKQVEAVAKVMKDQKEVPMQMSVEETVVDGHKALIAKMDFAGMLSKPEMAPAEGLLKSFFGEDLKMIVYIVHVSDTMIVTVMDEKDQIPKLVKVAKTKAGSLADNPGIKKVSAMLPADAQWFCYWSPAGTVDFANWIIAKLPEQLTENMPFEKLPPFPPCTPVGMAAKIDGGLMEKTFILPPDTLRAIMMYVMQLQMMGAH